MNVGKVGEYEVADEPAQGAANSSLTIEEGETAAELETRIEQREVRDSYGVEASCVGYQYRPWIP